MRRLPILPTILVLFAVAAMIGLGIWQLHRKAWKEDLLARYGANQTLAPIAFPDSPDESVLFRRSSATCVQPLAWTREVGRSASGAIGWRQIVRCQSEAGSPIFIQLGVAASPDARPGWTGGHVSGFISHAPDHRPLIETLLRRSGPKPLMLVAQTPPAGLASNAGPDLSAVPNNHLAYAVQWFLFAGVALVIYVLALRRRGRVLVSPPTRG